MRAKNEWGLGVRRGEASPRAKPPFAFPTQLFSFSRLFGSLEQANLVELCSSLPCSRFYASIHPGIEEVVGLNQVEAA